MLRSPSCVRRRVMRTEPFAELHFRSVNALISHRRSRVGITAPLHNNIDVRVALQKVITNVDHRNIIRPIVGDEERILLFTNDCR